MTLLISNHSPDRADGACSVPMPAPLPAAERSWQGNPPHSTSTGASVPAPTARTSS